MIIKSRPDIERFLKAPGSEVRAALIYGRDTGVVRERGQQLAGAVTDRPDDPFDVSLLTETDIDGDGARLEGELSAQSMGGGRRLVRLRLGEKVGPERIAAEALGAHLDGRLNPHAFFLVEAGNLAAGSALRKAAEKAQAAAVIPCYEDETGDIARMVRESLARDGVGIDTDALAVFTARLPKDRGVARREIERLVLYLGPGSGASASLRDLDDFLGVEPEASLSEAAADAFGARLAAARAGLRRAAAEGEQGPAAVRAIGMYLGRLRRTLTLAANGAGLQEAAKASGVFWKQEREFLRQARGWSLAELDVIQPEVLGADRACKQTGAPDWLIAERLAMQIASRARRLGL